MANLAKFRISLFSFADTAMASLGSPNSQGLTLDKIAIDIGKKDFSSDLSYVACSHVRLSENLLFIAPFNFQHLSKSKCLQERLIKDNCLQHMQQSIITSDNLYRTDLQQAAYTTTYATHNLLQLHQFSMYHILMK